MKTTTVIAAIEKNNLLVLFIYIKCNSENVSIMDDSRVVIDELYGLITYFAIQYTCFMGASSLIVLTLAAVFFSAGGILISKLVLKATKNPQKGQPYECGVPTIGQSWIQFHVGYYLFALIFLIFDVELIYLYPWAVVVKSVGWSAFGSIVIFLFILFMGFLYAHKKGALKWM